MGRKSAGLAEILIDFSQETGAHAISRVGDSRRRIAARITWAALFLVATGFFIYQSTILVKEYLTYPKNVETNLEFRALHFPAVTICNANQFIKH